MPQVTHALTAFKEAFAVVEDGWKIFPSSGYTKLAGCGEFWSGRVWPQVTIKSQARGSHHAFPQVTIGIDPPTQSKTGW